MSDFGVVEQPLVKVVHDILEFNIFPCFKLAWEVMHGICHQSGIR